MVNQQLSPSSPFEKGFSQPAEWAQHSACITAWPAHEYAWGPHLERAQREFIAFAEAFTHDPEQEPLHVLVTAELAAQAQKALAHVPRIVFRTLAYGDVWLRDTAPIFVRAGNQVGSVRFQFNGWGEKYIYPDDDTLAERLAAAYGKPDSARFACEFVLEGGSLDVDGLGTALTTRTCLLNENRGAPSEAVVAERLRDALGITKLIWLDAGLLNDHTDGHIDNIARFVAPGVVVCMQAHDATDPNRDVLEAIASELAKATDASGKPLRVVRIPSPGRVLSTEGEVIPASHMNFYIGNRSVLLPVFGTPFDDAAVAALQPLFPGRKVIARSARATIEGGGTFHCMTQQVP
jgi:agmatine deiminase